MKFLLFLLLPVAAIGFTVLAPLLDRNRPKDLRARSVEIRLTIFTWLIGALLLSCLLLPVPNKSRALMLVPIFFAAAVIGRIWKSARRRARRMAEFERMKRVN